MSERLRPVSEYATTVVRLFPDYAESVIWFSGPVAYEQTRLDADLVADLRAWDASYYAGLTDHEWSSPELAARHLRAGARLARRVADQIGDAFEVEHDLGSTHRRVRAAGPACNPAAAAAFHEMAERARAEWAALREVVEHARRSGETLAWSAEPGDPPPTSP